MKTPNEKLIGYAFGPAIFAGNSKANLDVTAKFTDPVLIELIKSGVRGLSPAMKMSKFQCSICKKDYELCPHEDGMLYNGVECHATALDLQTIEVSVVTEPADPKAEITDLLVIENHGNKRTYTWYGFKVDDDSRRFKHIQKACNQGLIPNSVGLRFSTFFTNNYEGIIKYPT